MLEGHPADRSALRYIVDITLAGQQLEVSRLPPIAELREAIVATRIGADVANAFRRSSSIREAQASIF
jgi:hypothetical protein